MIWVRMSEVRTSLRNICPHNNTITCVMCSRIVFHSRFSFNAAEHSCTTESWFYILHLLTWFLAFFCLVFWDWSCSNWLLQDRIWINKPMLILEVELLRDHDEAFLIWVLVPTLCLLPYVKVHLSLFKFFALCVTFISYFKVFCHWFEISAPTLLV